MILFNHVREHDLIWCYLYDLQIDCTLCLFRWYRSVLQIVPISVYSADITQVLFCRLYQCLYTLLILPSFILQIVPVSEYSADITKFCSADCTSVCILCWYYQVSFCRLYSCRCILLISPSFVLQIVPVSVYSIDITKFHSGDCTRVCIFCWYHQVSFCRLYPCLWTGRDAEDAVSAFSCLSSSWWFSVYLSVFSAASTCTESPTAP